MALEEGLCRAVESGEPNSRAERVSHLSASSETGAETGEEVTGSQCSGDNGLRRGEEAGMDG